MMSIKQMYRSIAFCERKIRKLKAERTQDWGAIHTWLDRIEELENMLRSVEAKS